MVFPPSVIPDPEDAGIDNGVRYAADVPQNVKDTKISTRRHRWFDVREIGTPTALYSTSRGLTAGSLFRIAFDHKPDWIIVSISGETAVTGRCRLSLGEEGGPAIPLGPTGQAVFPSPQNGVICLRNVGSTPTYGVVTAIAGFDNDPAPMIMCGN